VRIFQCQACDQVIYFENTHCLRCGHQLAYLPDKLTISALESADDGLWGLLGADDADARFKLCKNYVTENACNWALPATEDEEFCRSCRLTRTVPDLSQPQHRKAWLALEAAKRRLAYRLLRLKLPLAFQRQQSRVSLIFDFLADPITGVDPVPPAVNTGHSNGVVTINVAEADDAEREKRRLAMNEPYRTLLGHLRHESGHFYWDQLIREGGCAAGFRIVFGDETADYAASLERHYRDGPPGDWQSSFVSAYATAHPWEDWAETWAHYLHIADTLETAGECGLAIRPEMRELPRARPRFSLNGLAEIPFDQIINDWLSVTFLLNNLSRGLGQKDLYPFVLSQPVIEKLRFVHQTCAAAQELIPETSESNLTASNLLAATAAASTGRPPEGPGPGFAGNDRHPSGNATGSAPAAARMRSASVS